MPSQVLDNLNTDTIFKSDDIQELNLDDLEGVNGGCGGSFILIIIVEQ